MKSDLKYRAIEFGMLIDATLLALALGSQFRSIQAKASSPAAGSQSPLFSRIGAPGTKTKGQLS
ncbi:MAG: hypothetical protein IPL58_01110 [Betaproteobacteria bacterium]|uniref:Uncharacterized protein n=1 Tax=Candidatus Proximibacter danicus TaxID=2954365 RepID=A0A9D7K196_9PROT|nr:hypothetical protein [Candidatus Proximibacter danicus]